MLYYSDLVDPSFNLLHWLHLEKLTIFEQLVQAPRVINDDEIDLDTEEDDHKDLFSHVEEIGPLGEAEYNLSELLTCSDLEDDSVDEMYNADLEVTEVDLSGLDNIDFDDEVMGKVDDLLGDMQWALVEFLGLHKSLLQGQRSLL